MRIRRIRMLLTAILPIAVSAAEADAIIGICNRDLIAAAQHLVWVQDYSAGVERCVSVDKIRDGRVVLTNMQKISSPTIAEPARRYAGRRV